MRTSSSAASCGAKSAVQSRVFTGLEPKGITSELMRNRLMRLRALYASATSSAARLSAMTAASRSGVARRCVMERMAAPGTARVFEA